MTGEASDTRLDLDLYHDHDHGKGRVVLRGVRARRYITLLAVPAPHNPDAPNAPSSFLPVVILLENLSPTEKCFKCFRKLCMANVFLVWQTKPQTIQVTSPLLM